jgi:hypothetical protein
MDSDQTIYLKNKTEALAHFAALDRLHIVKALLEKKNFDSFYYELNKTLWNAITEKLSLLPTELNKPNIFKQLSTRGWTDQDNRDLESTMNEYERNLYVPGYKDESDYEGAFTKAVKIISKLIN